MIENYRNEILIPKQLATEAALWLIETGGEDDFMLHPSSSVVFYCRSLETLFRLRFANELYQL
jgi:hypothetical protein